MQEGGYSLGRIPFVDAVGWYIGEEKAVAGPYWPLHPLESSSDPFEHRSGRDDPIGGRIQPVNFERSRVFSRAC
jgi:hypothetical protein